MLNLVLSPNKCVAVVYIDTFLSLSFPPLLLEIVDGNLKMTLGMIWTIILRFAIQDISVEGERKIIIKH